MFTEVQKRMEPILWVRRLAIFSERDKLPFRDVSLQRGVNIVWAEDPEEPEHESERPPIVGHSTGKTTFCRLLRYCLGEPTFGTKPKQQLIRECFPSGYVGIELQLDGRTWAVARPIGHAKVAYVAQDVTLETLLAEGRNPRGYDDFLRNQLSETILKGVYSGGAGENEPITWGHLLAWCARDQETRFQSLWEWRSPRSQHEGAQFSSPKAGNLFLMRSVLHLFSPEELTEQEVLGTAEKGQKKAEDELAKAQRLPDISRRLAENNLRKLLDAPFTVLLSGGDLLTEDLIVLARKRLSTMNLESQRLVTEQRDLQASTQALSGERAKAETHLIRLEAASGVQATGAAEADVALSERVKLRVAVESATDGRCEFGDVPIRECEYVQRRRGELKFTEGADAYHAEQMEAKKREAEAKFAEKIAAQKVLVEQLAERLDAANARLAAIPGELRIVQTLKDKIQTALDSAVEALAMLADPAKNQDAVASVDSIAKTIKIIQASRTRLIVLEREHDENRALLQGIYNKAVRSVLSDGYGGRVKFSPSEIGFEIIHGPAMSGEAVETLTVLMADISAMLYSCTGRGCMPGFLVHDSPREADLSGRVYRSFFEYVAGLQKEYPEDQIPFQYIVTTTSAPPKTLRGEEFVKLRLSAKDEDGLLLRRNIGRPEKFDLNV